MGWAKPHLESVVSLGHSQLWPVNCKWGLRKQHKSSGGSRSGDISEGLRPQHSEPKRAQVCALRR